MSFSRRKVRTGRVVSDKMDKTVVVLIEWRRPHALYKKPIRRSSRFRVHDPNNEGLVGDLVRVIESRPISKTKRWRLVEVLEREEIADIQPEDIGVDPSVAVTGPSDEGEPAEIDTEGPAAVLTAEEAEAPAAKVEEPEAAEEEEEAPFAEAEVPEVAEEEEEVPVAEAEVPEVAEEEEEAPAAEEPEAVEEEAEAPTAEVEEPSAAEEEEDAPAAEAEEPEVAEEEARAAEAEEPEVVEEEARAAEAEEPEVAEEGAPAADAEEPEAAEEEEDALEGDGDEAETEPGARGGTGKKDEE